MKQAALEPAMDLESEVVAVVAHHCMERLVALEWLLTEPYPKLLAIFPPNCDGRPIQPIQPTSNQLKTFFDLNYSL